MYKEIAEYLSKKRDLRRAVTQDPNRYYDWPDARVRSMARKVVRKRIYKNPNPYLTHPEPKYRNLAKEILIHKGLKWELGIR